LQTFDEFASGRSNCPHAGPEKERGFETVFFLDFAPHPLKNFPRAFNTKELPAYPR
jgi:hypothetical protein